MPDARLVDISHSVAPYDIVQAAFVLRNAAPSFPAGTVHIIAVDTNIRLHNQFLVAKHNGQFFIGADNGIFSLLFDSDPEVFVIRPDLIPANDLSPDKNVFAPVAVKLINKADLLSLGDFGEIKNIRHQLKPVEDGNIIRGSIVFIDGYKTAITNISKQLFEQKRMDRPFAIFFRRKEQINHISENYDQVKAGDALALFNSNNWLEIAINTGAAGDLLGLKQGGQVIIEFYDQ